MNDDQSARINEKTLSQIPALHQLINLGFEYLTHDETMKERGRQASVSNMLSLIYSGYSGQGLKCAIALPVLEETI